MYKVVIKKEQPYTFPWGDMPPGEHPLTKEQYQKGLALYSRHPDVKSGMVEFIVTGQIRHEAVKGDVVADEGYTPEQLLAMDDEEADAKLSSGEKSYRTRLLNEQKEA